MPVLDFRAAVGGNRVRPTALGNALGNSIADGMQPGVDWSQAPDESAAETARLGRYQAAAAAQHASTDSVGIGGYNSDEARELGLVSSDAGLGLGEGPFADASDVLRLKPARDTRSESAISRGLEQRAQRNRLDELQRNIAELKALSAESSSWVVGGDGLKIQTSFPFPAENLPDGGFFRGLVLGQSGSALDAYQPNWAENVGAGVRGLLMSPINTVTGLVGELGSQYSDMYNLLTRSRSDFTPSSTMLDSLERNGIGGTLLNIGNSVLSAPSKPIFDLLEGRYEQAGAGLPGTLAMGLGLARGVRLGGDAPFSPIVPGGGLMTHELAGGHLLLKHVGQTERQLLDRLAAEPHITGSSSFYDRPTAEAAVAAALDARQADIGAWLATSKPQMKLEYTLQDPVGISVGQGMSSAADASGLRLILRRDPTIPTGYRIHTGFPIK